MKPPIVFFGTGPVSLSCLEGIYDAFEIEAIITKPDRKAPSGRTHEHPVRAWAESHEVPLHQVADKAALTKLFDQERFSSSAGLVVDFGMIIPAVVIAAFARGIINSHFSLLPRLRGADPISFAILGGQTRTGVSLMKIVARLDEGDLIAQEEYALPAVITTPELTSALSDLSNGLLREYLPKYIKDEIKLWPQDPAVPPTYTRRLTKADGALDWRKPAAQLEREVRAFISWPGSRAELFSRSVTVTAARLVSQLDVASSADAVTHLDFQLPGTVLRGWPDRLFVVCGDGVLEILRLTPAGKRPMDAAAFLRGLPSQRT
jgi:methionyl-tRNA formyltransferase